MQFSLEFMSNPYPGGFVACPLSKMHLRILNAPYITVTPEEFLTVSLHLVYRFASIRRR